MVVTETAGHLNHLLKISTFYIIWSSLLAPEFGY